MKIDSLPDLAEHFGMDRGASMAQVKKAVYKGTDCGAWIEFDFGPEETVGSCLLVGSIVEGCDVDCETHRLKLPTTSEKLGEALSVIEDEASQLWNEWNLNETS
jgi:hypothetical protein